MMIEISLEQYNDMAERLAELEWKLGEAVQGEWIKTVDGNGWNEWWVFKCPFCGATIEDKQYRSWEYNFCPNCGARMEKVE